MQFPDKKSAETYLIATKKDPKQYDIMYIYADMSRRQYPPSYTKLHNKAARDYYQRHKAMINKRRREEYAEKKAIKK